MATDAERRSALQAEVARRLTLGAQLESQTDYMAVVVGGKKVNHILHLVLSLLTAGLWLIVWVILVATNKKQRTVITVDEGGVLHTSMTTS